MHTNAGLRLLRALAEHGEPMPDYLVQPCRRPATRPEAKDRTALEAAAARPSRRTHRRRA